jgi:histidyl-tRNA synthetase
VLRAFGLTEKDFVVRLSDRQFWTDFMNANGVPEDQRYAFIQAIDKSEREPREKTAEKLGPLAEKVFAILADAGSAKSERLDTVETGLRHRGLQDYVKRDYTVVRGLAYYTGVVWEVFDRSGEFRAIAGGGRYDTLLKNLGGVDLPALGFGIGDVVLGEILKAKQWKPAQRSANRIYLIIADEAFRSHAMGVLQHLRETTEFFVDYSFIPAKVGKQFQAAEERGCAFAVLVDAQIQNTVVQVKDLGSRQQIESKVDDLKASLRRLRDTPPS